MSWTTAKQDLIIRLSDGPTDKYNYRKRCFGEINGSNRTFKTFDYRRITNFTLISGVYIDGSVLAPNLILSDNVLTGEFVVDPSITPQDGSIVEANYYIQWFLDAELEDFLVQGSRWLLSSDQYINIPLGLTPATLEFAAGRAYSKMAERWRMSTSSTFKVEDSPKDNPDNPTKNFSDLANAAYKQADELIKMFYTRQRQNLQPLFGVVRGNIRSMP